jgi:hypothetical protein
VHAAVLRDQVSPPSPLTWWTDRLSAQVWRLQNDWHTWSRSRAQFGPLVACIAVALAATLPYLQTVPNYFLGDDFGLVWAFYDQPPLHFLSLFVRSWDAGVYGDVPDEIRPLIALSYQVDFFLGAGAPNVFHVSNIVFHVLNALLVAGVARVLGRLSWPAATLSGALFAVLPIHAETVAWISGRADAIPALFYLASLLGFGIWRRCAIPLAYVAAVVCCFLALFSKQNAITIPLMIVAYDLVLEHRWPRPAWAYVRPYLPFVVLTAVYLGLRYALFGNVVRENIVTPRAMMGAVADTIANQLEILFFGYFVLENLPSAGRVAVRSTIVGVSLLSVVFVLLRDAIFERRDSAPVGASSTSRLVFFGPVWWLISVAPLAVTYATPRHLYLPAVGLTVVVGIVFDAICERIATRQTLAHTVVRMTALAVLATCLAGLLRPIGEWSASAGLSEKMARDMHAEVRGTPAGSLIVLGGQRTAELSPPALAPQLLHDISPTPGRPWLWSFATPYVHQTPFTPESTSGGVEFVGPLSIDCCGAEQWFDRSISAIESWANRSDPVPLLVLAWQPSSGELVRASDSEAPCLRKRMMLLAGAWSAELLDRGIVSLVSDVARGQPCGSTR